MRKYIMKKSAILVLLAGLAIFGADASEAKDHGLAGMIESNDVMKWCVQEHGDNYSKIASCHQDYRSLRKERDLNELRAFLKKNPQYKWPGGSAGMPHPLKKEATKAWFDINAIALGQPTYDLKMQFLVMQAAK
jgi:hypothetical protein